MPNLFKSYSHLKRIWQPFNAVARLAVFFQQLELCRPIKEIK